MTVAPTPNQPPTASFTSSCTDLACSFNGTGSTDPDGTIASYAWNWGDATADGSGATANHTYAAAGTYTARLTVTDNNGATGTTTSPVTVTAPPPVTVLAADAFGRTLATRLGHGRHRWRLDVQRLRDGALGRRRASARSGSAPGRVRGWPSRASRPRRTDLARTIALDKVPTGSGAYVSLNGRRVAGRR